MKKTLFLGVLATRMVFGTLFLSIPVAASAGIFSILSSMFADEVVSEEENINSQNMALLQAAPSPDPLSARGGGDVIIDGGVAIRAESGPNGSLADLSESSGNGHISVYVVRPGDTLSQIAKMYGVSVNTIIWSNDIKGGVIQPGQTLVILPVSGIQHTVKKGDTVASIAKQYKGDADEILQYNGIAAGQSLTVGSVVIVPDGELATAPVARPSTLRGANGPEYNGYYLRPIIGGRKSQGLHGYNGVDLATYRGAPVLASAAGDVIIARNGGWNGGYGSYVVISHSNGTQTLYSHLSGVEVTAGSSVVRGQVIGYVGSTGKSTGPHLHFEIRGARNPF